MINYQQGSQKKDFFRGRCSLPFFFKGVSEFKKINTTSKQVLTANNASSEPRYMKIFIELLIEMIV